MSSHKIWGKTTDCLLAVHYLMSGGRGLAKALLSRWAKSIIDSEKEFFAK